MSETAVLNRKPVCGQQIVALKKRIVASPDASDFCKKAILFLIGRSEYLTRSVRFNRESHPRTQEVVVGMHKMSSTGGKTLINDFMRESGIKGHFHYGCVGFNYEQETPREIEPLQLDFDPAQIELVDLNPYQD